MAKAKTKKEIETITLNELLRRLIDKKHKTLSEFVEEKDLKNQGNVSYVLNKDKDGKSKITFNKALEYLEKLDEPFIIKTSIGTFQIK